MNLTCKNKLFITLYSLLIYSIITTFYVLSLIYFADISFCDCGTLEELKSNITHFIVEYNKHDSAEEYYSNLLGEA